MAINKSSHDINNIIIISSATNGTGGGDTHLNYLTRYWKNYGIKIDILSNKKFNKFNLLNNIKYSFISIDRLIKINDISIKKILNADIILSASPYPADLFLSIRLAKKYNKKVMCYFHHIVPGLLSYPIRRGFFRTLLNIIYFKFALYIVKNNNIAIFLDHPKTLKNSKIKVYEDLDAIEPKLLNKRNNIIKVYDLCFIGRVTKPKGIIDLIKVARMLHDDGFNMKIAIVGAYNDTMKIKLDKLIDRYKLKNNFVFFGYVNSDKKYQILSESKIFISLSYEEGWNIAVMEAASLSIPIIAYKLTAYSYLGDNYFSATLGDINNIKILIECLINNTEKYDTYTNNAKKLVDAYNYQAIAVEQLKYIDNFLTK